MKKLFKPNIVNKKEPNQPTLRVIDWLKKCNLLLSSSAMQTVKKQQKNISDSLVPESVYLLPSFLISIFNWKLGRPENRTSNADTPAIIVWNWTLELYQCHNS